MRKSNNYLNERKFKTPKNMNTKKAPYVCHHTSYFFNMTEIQVIG